MVKDSWMVYFLCAGCLLVVYFGKNKTIITETKYIAYIWACLIAKLTINLMISHIIHENVKRFDSYVLPLILFPYIILISDQLAANGYISDNFVSFEIKVFCGIVVACNFIRFYCILDLFG